jgi:endonuclease/exonuclease/phosphatase family metal-dependent hydrolase/regulation of enolase protein 1 (concanavalin A-like superfamily)
MSYRIIPARVCFVLALFVLFVTTDVRGASLPAGWASADVGGVAVDGATSYTADVFHVTGAGADIWGSHDEFRFVYRQLTGDGEVVARLDSLQQADEWTKAGVMMRESLDAAARHAFMLASAGKGYAFQFRTATSAASRHVLGGSGTAPVYVRLTRSGSTFAAYRSRDGLEWTKVGTTSISMPGTIFVGLAVTSHAAARTARAAFSHVTVSTPVATGWKTADVGAVGRVGAAAGTTADMTLKGAGTDIWDRADSFRFAYTMLEGDGEIVTRVASVQNVDSWSKAGVMMRESLAAGAKHAFMLLSAGKGYAFQRRTAFNADSASTSGGRGSAPGYVRLVRRGSTFTAYTSSTGSGWTTVGSASISMVSRIYVGVAVTSHSDPALASARFTGTTVATRSPGGGDVEPDGSSTSTSTLPPAPSSDDSSPSTATLRVLHWNLHHGVGTDGKYDINRIATWIAKTRPDVVSLNEVEKYTYWGNENQPARYEALLESKTGRNWYAVWAQEYGNWSSNGKGNLLLSRFPLSSTARYELSYDRTVALGQFTVNGRTITVATTHLDPESGSRRLTQTKELLAWFSNFPEARIVAGDMNAQPTSTEMTLVKETSVDSWAAAKSDGYAYSASDNPNGYTRNSRIDFMFRSKRAGVLTPTRVEVVDTRDSAGVMPSDHRPILSVFTVN